MTDYRAWSQLDPQLELAETVATTLVARTANYAEWMGGEVQRRGVAIAWVPRNLGWLLERSGVDPSTVPAEPYPGDPAPTMGQVWPRTLTAYLDSDGGWTRRNAIITTAALGVGGREVGLVQLAPGYRLYRLVTSVPARVRLYTSVAKRDADVSRSIVTASVADSGLVLDYVTTASFLGGDLSPVIGGFDDKSIPDGMIAYTIDNLDTAAGTVSCTFTYLRTE